MMEFQDVPEIEKKSRPWAKSVDIGPPPGIGEDDCGVAHTLVEKGEGAWKGTLMMYTYFRPTEEELKILNEGGLVRFHQIGAGMVPHGALVIIGDKSELECIGAVRPPQPPPAPPGRPVG